MAGLIDFKRTNFNLERHGSGTVIYIHEGFSYNRTSLNNNDFDMVLCTLKFQRSRPLVIGCIYRSPSNSNLYSNFTNLLDEVDLANSELYLLGDFNCPINSAKGKEFIKFMSDIGLNQLIKENNRVTATSSSLIDMIFTNSHRVTESGLLKLSFSDRYMMYCNRSCKLPRSKPKVLNVRSFKNFDPLAFVLTSAIQSTYLIHRRMFGLQCKIY